MGKGVVSDKNEHCVSPARSAAFQKADVIVLFGARLNWMLHFGRPPRFNPSVKVIQVTYMHLDIPVCQFILIRYNLIIRFSLYTGFNLP